MFLFSRCASSFTGFLLPPLTSVDAATNTVYNLLDGGQSLQVHLDENMEESQPPVRGPVPIGTLFGTRPQ